MRYIRPAIVFLMMFSAFFGAVHAQEEYLRGNTQGRWIDNEMFDPAGEVDMQWWREFNDSLLDSLITLGVENNYNVAMAARRVTVARNTLRSVQSGYFPTLDLSAGYSRGRTSGLTMDRSGEPVTTGVWQGVVSLSWEIDLFGRIASQAKSKKAQWRASKAEYASVMLAVEAQIAETYMQLRSLQAQMEVALYHSESQKEVMEMTRARYESGLASKLDVTQARRVYFTTISTIPNLESSIQTCINSLAVVLGVYPQEIYARLAAGKPMPDYRRIIGAGVPANLLTRRPDVAQAREQIASSVAAVGVAKKDYLPVLSLTGSVGTAAHNAGDLFKKDSYTYSIAPTLSWTIFDGLARKYNLSSAREQLEMDIEQYNLTMLTAVEEVDNAMSAYKASVRYISLLERVVEESREALRLAIDLYKLDLSAFTNVVDAQLTFLESQNELAAAKGSALSRLVDIYKALGGGWDVSMIK